MLCVEAVIYLSGLSPLLCCFRGRLRGGDTTRLGSGCHASTLLEVVVSIFFSFLFYLEVIFFPALMIEYRVSRLLGECSAMLVTSHLSFYFSFLFWVRILQACPDGLEPTLAQVYLEPLALLL